MPGYFSQGGIFSAPLHSASLIEAKLSPLLLELLRKIDITKTLRWVCFRSKS